MVELPGVDASGMVGASSSDDNIVFFDVETQRLAQEVGGWGFVSKLGLAAAVTYSSRDGVYRHFREEEVEVLVNQLAAADLVVGFNVLRFDYAVLQPYTSLELKRLPTLDLLEHIHQRLGFRVSLESLATATLGSGKSDDGIQAVHWYKTGRLDLVLAYCEQDVAVTRGLYEFGRTNKFVQYRDRGWRLRKVPVSW